MDEPEKNTVEYQGYEIIGDSYMNENGKWTAQAKINAVDSGAKRPDYPILCWQEEFESEQQANEYAAQSAQIYIDCFLDN